LFPLRRKFESEGGIRGASWCFVVTKNKAIITIQALATGAYNKEEQTGDGSFFALDGIFFSHIWISFWSDVEDNPGAYRDPSSDAKAGF
jgi:hypothetical protein